MDLSSLNEKQLEAVLYNDGPLAVLSTSGSGKTRTVTTKIAYLISELNYRPSSVWACTFTNKAANEMKDRLEEMLGDKASSIKIATLHSTANRITKFLKQRENPSYKAPTPLFSDAAAFFYFFYWGRKEKLRSLDMKMYLQEIAHCKLNLITLDNFKKHKPYIEDDFEYDFNQDLHKVYKQYQSFLRAKNKIDFNDMLVICYQTLIDPKYAMHVERLRERINYLLVDETQDTNLVSFKIIDEIIKDKGYVTIVGDCRQLIYSFQGASMGNIHNFIKTHSPKIIDLNINYRSSKTIVEASNSLIANASGIIGEAAITPNDVGSTIKYMTTYDTGMEGEAVHDLVLRLVEGGCEYRDIAILYRVHSQSIEVEDQFMLNDIPYLIHTKSHFYFRKEIKDLLTYLKIIVDKDEVDIADLKRIANRPTRYLGNKTMDEFENYCFDNDLNLWSGMQRVFESDLSYREQEAIDKLYGSLSGLSILLASGSSTTQLIEYILKDIKYEEWAIKEMKAKNPEADVTLNLDALKTSVGKFETPQEFLDFVAETLELEKKKKKDVNGDYVNMMTVHASKGLEFRYVIVLGVSTRIFPFYRAVEENNEEEEKRVMYVAITRPKEELFLSIIDGRIGRYEVSPSPYVFNMDIGYKGGSNV